MNTNTLGVNLEETSFELFRHDPFIAFATISASLFSKLEVSLKSEPHSATKRALSGHWSSKDFKWLQLEGSETNDELFKVVARQKVNRIQDAQDAERQSYRYARLGILDQEIEQISLKYQIISNQTTFLGISKND